MSAMSGLGGGFLFGLCGACSVFFGSPFHSLTAPIDYGKTLWAHDVGRQHTTDPSLVAGTLLLSANTLY